MNWDVTVVDCKQYELVIPYCCRDGPDQSDFIIARESWFLFKSLELKVPLKNIRYFICDSVISYNLNRIQLCGLWRTTIQPPVGNLFQTCTPTPVFFTAPWMPTLLRERLAEELQQSFCHRSMLCPPAAVVRIAPGVPSSNGSMIPATPFATILVFECEWQSKWKRTRKTEEVEPNLWTSNNLQTL